VKRTNKIGDEEQSPRNEENPGAIGEIADYLAKLLI
jgi:ADP-dependent phosphofructokinase/glucokinase